MIQPITFGHPSISFQGRKYDIIKEGSREYIDLPWGVNRGQADELAAHGFIYEGMLTQEIVDTAAQEAIKARLAEDSRPATMDALEREREAAHAGEPPLLMSRESAAEPTATDNPMPKAPDNEPAFAPPKRKKTEA
jgi:hypothetical protein